MSTLLLTGPTWYAADGTATTRRRAAARRRRRRDRHRRRPEGRRAAGCRRARPCCPGFVDLHTHLREPGREDTETIASGSRAAAVGGYTAVLAMANTTPVTDTAEAAERILDLGRAAGLVDVVPVGAVTKGLEGAELAELGLMHRSRAASRRLLRRRPLRRRRPGDAPGPGVRPRLRRRGLPAQPGPHLAGPQACCHEGETSGRLGLPGWPAVAEASIIARDALLAEHTRSRVHVAHVSTAEGLDVVRWAKARGIRMTAEVTPHHLALGTELLTGYDPVFKVNPPLRPTEDREALVEGLLDGTIDAIATDHAPHARHDKEHAFVDAAFGMLGLETAFAVVHDLLVADGRLGWADLTRLMSTGPARIAGLADHGHPVAPGAPANLVLVDPAATLSVDRDASQSLSRNTPWHGETLTGAVHTTILRGRVTARGGEPTAC